MISREWAFERSPGHYRCPSCEKLEISCSVWDEAGSRHVKCHRASCGAYARYPMGLEGLTIAKIDPTLLRPYQADRINLRIQQKADLLDRFNFIPLGIQTVGYGTELDRTPYIIPILAPNGQERGVVEAVFGPPKTRRIWKAKDEPMISWTQEGDFYDGVYLVEDQISALKLHDVASIRAVALLGTNLNIQSVAEIQRYANHVTIALDADASWKAFMLARKWGSAFKSCRVQILTRDIKDTPSKDILEMTRHAGHGDFSSGSEF